MLTIGDMDPANPALVYLCDRFEFNMEQRYWLAFLYAASYCAPTAWYIYNEFPDYDLVDLGRMERWWRANRERVVFQTDRRWVRSRNQFVEQVASYRAVVGPVQEESFGGIVAGNDERKAYDLLLDAMSRVKFFGRFSLFLYLEAVAALTGLPIEPTGLDLRYSESSRNGLCYAFGHDHMLCGHDYGRSNLSPDQLAFLGVEFETLERIIKGSEGEQPLSTVWSIETSLCAYKKLHRGQRYLGYYIDRQAREIAQAQNLVTEGVDWSVLWHFRDVHFAPLWRKEWRTEHGGDPRTYRPSDPEHWYQRGPMYR